MSMNILPLGILAQFMKCNNNNNNVDTGSSGGGGVLILEPKHVTETELQEMIPDYSLVVETLASNAMRINEVLVGGTANEIENNFCLIKTYDDTDNHYDYEPILSFHIYGDYSISSFEPYITIAKSDGVAFAAAFDPESVLFTIINLEE